MMLEITLIRLAFALPVVIAMLIIIAKSPQQTTTR